MQDKVFQLENKLEYIGEHCRPATVCGILATQDTLPPVTAGRPWPYMPALKEQEDLLLRKKKTG